MSACLYNEITVSLLHPRGSSCSPSPVRILQVEPAGVRNRAGVFIPDPDTDLPVCHSAEELVSVAVQGLSFILGDDHLTSLEFIPLLLFFKMCLAMLRGVWCLSSWTRT